jgi:iron(III) transport system substrate-binding protein
MTTRRTRATARLAASIAIAAAFGFASAARSAETWDQIVEGAKKEGELIVHVGPGKAFRDGRLKGFAEAFPFLNLQVINTANRESMPKLMRERQAGIYALDLHHGGLPNLIRVYKPQGFLVPFRDAIVLPELMDDKVWKGGFADGFQDLEGKYIYAYNMTVNLPGHVNWQHVGKNELKSLNDLLDPKWANKIVWHDPRSPGPGFATATALYYSFGEEYLTKLLQQQSVFTSNRRQAAEWVVRGRYPIGLGTARDFMLIFEQQGLGKTVEEIPAAWLKKATMSSGNGNLVMMDRAPHPNAAKLYVNWFMKREQQQQWNEMTDQASRRLDTKPNHPSIAPDPKVSYTNVRHEREADTTDKILKLARSVIKAARDQGD